MARILQVLALEESKAFGGAHAHIVRAAESAHWALNTKYCRRLAWVSGWCGGMIRIVREWSYAE
jgi:hypothetical protein